MQTWWNYTTFLKSRVHVNKCTDTAAQISLCIVCQKTAGGGGGGVWRVIYGTSLNICSEICHRHNEISCLQSGARSVGGQVSPQNESAAHLCFDSKWKTHFSKLLSWSTALTLKSKTSCALERVAHSSSRVSGIHEPRLHYACVPYTCHRGVVWIINSTYEMLGGASHTSQLDIHKKKCLVFMQRVGSSRGYTNGLGNCCTSPRWYRDHSFLPRHK